MIRVNVHALAPRLAALVFAAASAFCLSSPAASAAAATASVWMDVRVQPQYLNELEISYVYGLDPVGFTNLSGSAAADYSSNKELADGHITLNATAGASAAYPPVSWAEGFGTSNSGNLVIKNIGPEVLLGIGVTMTCDLAVKTGGPHESARAFYSALASIDVIKGDETFGGDLIGGPRWFSFQDEISISGGPGDLFMSGSEMQLALILMPTGSIIDISAGSNVAYAYASAVPEPGAFGLAGGVLLMLAMCLRLRWKTCAV